MKSQVKSQMKRLVLIIVLCLVAGAYALYSRKALPPGLSADDMRSLTNAVLPETANCLSDSPAIEIDVKNATSEALNEAQLKSLLYSGLGKAAGDSRRLLVEISSRERRNEKVWHLTYEMTTSVPKPDGTRCTGHARLSRVGKI